MEIIRIFLNIENKQKIGDKTLKKKIQIFFILVYICVIFIPLLIGDITIRFQETWLVGYLISILVIFPAILYILYRVVAGCFIIFNDFNWQSIVGTQKAPCDTKNGLNQSQSTVNRQVEDFEIILQMLKYRNEVENNKPNKIIPPPLLKKSFDELGYFRTYDSVQRLLGFIGLKNFPIDFQKAAPVLRINREREWCRDIEYLLKTIPELSEIYALNRKDEVVFSDKLSKNEKQELIDYVGERDEVVLLQSSSPDGPMTEKIVKNIKKFFSGEPPFDVEKLDKDKNKD